MNDFDVDQRISAYIDGDKLIMTRIDLQGLDLVKTLDQLLILREKVSASHSDIINIGNNYWGKTLVERPKILAMLNWAVEQLNRTLQVHFPC